MAKRFILILSLLIISTVGLSAISLNGETSSTPETTTSAIEQTTDSLYSYTDKEDLINQLYDDLYPKIREEIYTGLLENVRTNLQEDIYNSILSKFNEFLNQPILSVSLDELQTQITEVSELSDQSVLGVTSYLGEVGVSLGSAVIYDYDETSQTYYVITNHHVIDEADNYKIVFSDRSAVEATLLGYDKDVDIAVLSFSGENLSQSLSVSPLGSSSTLTKGEIILASGNPKGYDFYNTLTLGVVAGVNRTTEWDILVPYIQHDAAINSGNSGGPIYNLHGEVVGINVAKYATDEIEGMGFAIPIDMVKDVVNSIRMLGGSFTDIVGNVSLNWVDVNPNEFSITSTLPEVRLILPDQVTRGLMINLLLNDEVMQKAGLSIGDLIVKVDNFNVATLYPTYQYINQNYQKGQSMTLWFYRLNKSTLTFSTTLESVTFLI